MMYSQIFDRIEQGELRLFNDFQNNGEMWIGEGNREVRKFVGFNSEFMSSPVVHISVSLMDGATDAPQRYALKAENITKNGFDVIFNTWLDSRFARVWVNWIAFGNVCDKDNWHDL